MTDISSALKELAAPSERGETIKSIITRAARRADLGYWRAFNIWYGKADKISDCERVRVAQALEKKRREDARNELHELRFLLERLESRLNQNDPEFHRPSIDAVRDHIRTMDGKRRP